MHSDDNGIKNSFVLKVKYYIICIEVNLFVMCL